MPLPYYYAVSTTYYYSYTHTHSLSLSLSPLPPPPRLFLSSLLMMCLVVRRIQMAIQFMSLIHGTHWLIMLLMFLMILRVVYVHIILNIIMVESTVCKCWINVLSPSLLPSLLSSHPHSFPPTLSPSPLLSLPFPPSSLLSSLSLSLLPSLPPSFHLLYYFTHCDNKLFIYYYACACFFALPRATPHTHLIIISSTNSSIISFNISFIPVPLSCPVSATTFMLLMRVKTMIWISHSIAYIQLSVIEEVCTVHCVFKTWFTLQGHIKSFINVLVYFLIPSLLSFNYLKGLT